MTTIRIATRGSKLARWQAEHVARRLEALHAGLSAQLVPIVTRGDKMLHAPLAEIGGKGWFVKELEKAIFDARADIAVHSMKDVPVELAPGLSMPVITAREDPRDVLVCEPRASLDTLPAGSRVGTSSLRRQCQLRALRPDLAVVNLRGNVDTRLGKLARGEFDAVVLASAGMKRLGLQDSVSEYLEPDRFLPAVGQGAMGIECRDGDAAVRALIAPLNDAETAARVLAERAMNRRLEGGCQVPIAGYATHDGAGRLHLRGLVARVDGSEVLRETRTGEPGETESLGHAVADALLARGAGVFLAEAYAGG